MNNLYPESAKVCASNSCVTVYGETAKLVNAIAVITASLVAITLIAKALK